MTIISTLIVVLFGAIFCGAVALAISLTKRRPKGRARPILYGVAIVAAIIALFNIFAVTVGFQSLLSAPTAISAQSGQIPPLGALQTRPEQGDAAAQLELADRYFTHRDYSQAAKWFRMAAAQGNAIGQSQLGFLYAVGRGVKQDDVEAAKWERKAAEQGNVAAQFFVGLLL